ncbi:glycosyltransferase [Limnobaculum xujianqingii]|uniref:glycosyltransferase n=1 Tax=Limnobaculum xujianqingii TaxID=2738837 RepID=UPI00112E26E9|nr:glycosyltransferase family 2 protein [Limnobaculum xujianqingii]
MKISILVVIYNENILYTETYKSLVTSFSIVEKTKINYDVIFWDNSEKNFNSDNVDLVIADFERLNVNVQYINTPENVALSALYNKTLSNIKGGSDYVILLDQDSEFDIAYFSELEQVITEFSPDIILPIIYYHSKVVSPTRIFFVKGSYFDVPPYGFTRLDISAINSGMIICLDFVVRTDFSYNPSIRNYCTDDDIMRHARRYLGKMYVMKYSFNHHLTLSTLNENSEKLRLRYKEMIKSKTIVFGDTVFKKLMVTSYFVIHRFYMALKYRDWKYLWG